MIPLAVRFRWRLLRAGGHGDDVYWKRAYYDVMVGRTALFDAGGWPIVVLVILQQALVNVNSTLYQHSPGTIQCQTILMSSPDLISFGGYQCILVPVRCCCTVRRDITYLRWYIRPFPVLLTCARAFNWLVYSLLAFCAIALVLCY